MEQKQMGYLLALRISADGEKCFGPGIAKLLYGVAEHGSLLSAAKGMGMAYSKAWRIVRDAEQALGFPLLRSFTGGRHGGGAALTCEAEDMLKRYEGFEQEVSAAADAALARWF